MLHENQLKGYTTTSDTGLINVMEGVHNTWYGSTASSILGIQCIYLSIFLCVASDCAISAQPYAQLDINAAEFAEHDLQATQAVADNDTDGAVVFGNRLVKPQDIREYHYSKDCGNVFRCQLLMV